MVRAGAYISDGKEKIPIVGRQRDRANLLKRLYFSFALHSVQKKLMVSRSKNMTTAILQEFERAVRKSRIEERHVQSSLLAYKEASESPRLRSLPHSVLGTRVFVARR